MVLRKTIEDREWDKFEEDEDGLTRVRVRGNFSISGLKNGGYVTEVELNPSTWTALPITALANRNSMSLQNPSAQNVKINYDYLKPLPAGWEGVLLGANGGERFYDVTEDVILYGKTESANAFITVEEIS